jgi:hypothetical protein
MTETPAYGTADHAALVTYGRDPGVQTAMAWLAFSHLPDPLKSLCAPIYDAALELLRRIPADSAELTTMLNALVEAKDWSVRAGIRSDQGKPGPVPRPATVIDPPAASGITVCPGDFSCRPELPCRAEVHWWNVDPPSGPQRPTVGTDLKGPSFGRKWREPTYPAQPIQDGPQA